MKKNKLIELLQQIDGNPDIVLWNGLVGDYQHISSKFIKEYLTKLKFDTYISHVEFEIKRDLNNFDYKLSGNEIEELKKDYKKYHKWEYNKFIDMDSEFHKSMYKKKNVVFLQSNPRGEVYWDRNGNISY